jgi:hypothetical protein
MQKEYFHNLKHIEMHNVCHINKEIMLGFDDDGETITGTIRQLLMDDVDVEGERN